MKLTKKQDRFVDEFLVDLNATQAAIRAGYSKRSAAETGYENLRKPQIQKALQERYEGLVISGEIATPEEVLGGYTKDSRFDPRKLFDENKDPLPIPDLPDEIALSLAGFEINDTILKSDNDNEETVIKRVYKYKFPDKHKNRDSLGKFHNLFVEQHEHRLSKETLQVILECLPEDFRNKVIQRLEQMVATGKSNS